MCDALTTSLPVDDWTLNDKAQSEEASLCNKGLVFLMYAGICNYKSIKTAAAGGTEGFRLIQHL